MTNPRCFVGMIFRYLCFLVFLTLFVVGCGLEELETKKLFTVPEAMPSWAAVTFSSNDELFALITEDQQIQIRNLPNNQLLQILKYSEDNLPGMLAFSSDGTRLAVSTENEVHIWDIENLDDSPVRLVDNIYTGRGTVAFSPDDSHLALFSNKTLRIWNIQSGKITTKESLPGFQIALNMAFSPNGNLLIINSGPVFIWDVYDAKLAGKINESTKNFAISNDGSELVTTSNNKVQRWRLPDGETLGNFTVGENTMAFVLPPDASEVLAFTIGRSDAELDNGGIGPFPIYISRWDIGNSEMVWSQKVNDIELLDLVDFVTSPSGKWFAMIGIGNNGVHFWQVGKERNQGGPINPNAESASLPKYNQFIEDDSSWLHKM